MNFSLARLRTVAYSTLFRRWMIVCMASILIGRLYFFGMGIGFSHFGLFRIYANLPPVLQAIQDFQDFYRYTSEGLIDEGLFLGLCQWLVIRRQFTKSYGWLVALVLGGAITFLANAIILWLVYSNEALIWEGIFYPLMRIAPPVLAMGLGFGFAQWLFFRGRSCQAYLWIVAVTASQFLYEIITYSFDSVLRVNASNIFLMLEGSPAPRLLTAILLGAVELALLLVTRGLLTGWVLVGFVAEEKRQIAVRS